MGVDSEFPDVGRLPLRLAWVTGLRLALLTVLLSATGFFYLKGALGQYPQSQTIVLFTIGSAYALAAIYSAILRTGRHLRELAVAQVLLDQVTWTALVYISGGPTSGATSFYGLTCLVGAILIGTRGAAFAAASGIAFFTLLCGGLAFRWIRPPADQAALSYSVGLDESIYPLLVNVLGIGVVGLLAGYLAERLRRAGGALVIANQRVVAAERLAMLGTIAAGLAHEIRNPLGSIAGSIELLREASGLTDEDRQLCDIIQREAARLNHLVTDMMDLARRRKPEPRAVDVTAVAREVVELASRTARSGSGDVAVRYVGPDDPRWALFDPAQLRQVLWNLVRNGVQVSPPGTTVRVAVGDRRADGARVGDAPPLTLTVVDEGPGIAEEARAKIFDAFYTTREHGAGVGLAVVRRILDEHAGVGATLRLLDGSASRGAAFEIGLRSAPAPFGDDAANDELPPRSSLSVRPSAGLRE